MDRQAEIFIIMALCRSPSLANVRWIGRKIPLGADSCIPPEKFTLYFELFSPTLGQREQDEKEEVTHGKLPPHQILVRQATAG
jgi:hypothetical protein